MLDSDVNVLGGVSLKDKRGRKTLPVVSPEPPCGALLGVPTQDCLQETLSSSHQHKNTPSMFWQ